MSWQEELRRLDEELAAGQLSADDYRVRRDQVLSSAVTQGESEAVQGQHPDGDLTQVVQPVNPQAQPPQQQPDVQQSGAEATQFVQNPNIEAERTQVAPAWQAQQPQYQQPQYQQPPQQQFPQQQPPQPAGASAPTGGFPSPDPTSPPGGLQQASQPWNAPEQDDSPPWGGADFPPIAPTGSSDWTKQGPEGFDDTPTKNNTGKIVSIVLAVLLLGGIGVGAFLLLGGDEENTAGGQPETSEQQSPPLSTSQAPPDPLPIADLPGQVESHEDITSFTDVPELNYLNPQEIEAYEAVQPGDTKFAVRLLDNGNRITLLLIQVGDRDAALDEITTLADIQVTNGATLTDNAPAGVQVTEIDKKDGGPAQVRGHYLSDDVLVRIELSSEEDLSSAQKDFDDTLSAQLEVLSADD